MQRIWRSYNVRKVVAEQLRQEWETILKHQALSINRTWISNSFLRPFLFFITQLSTRRRKIQPRDIDCMRNCFRILLESINSPGTPFFYLPTSRFLPDLISSLHHLLIFKVQSHLLGIFGNDICR